MEDNRPETTNRAAAPSDSEGRPRVSFWSWAGALVPMGLSTALGVIAHRMPEQVERHFAHGLYPRLAEAVGAPARALNRLAGPVDLREARPSLAEFGLLAGVIAAALWIGLRWRRRGGSAMLRGVLVLVGLGYGAFLLSWGLLYARQPLAVSLGLRAGPVQVTELDAAAQRLAAELDAMHRLVAGLPEPLGEYGVLAAAAWGQAIAAEPALGWQPDPVLAAPVLSRALTASGISGIFSPMTQECHVAVGLTAIDRGFTACHEIAHLQGWAREDEANYLAWRVASRSGNPWLRRSALALALLHVHRALARADVALQAERARELSGETVELFEKRAAFWRGARVPAAAGAARTLNDRYLKSQGQRGGVASYGRMVDLLIAEFR